MCALGDGGAHLLVEHCNECINGGVAKLGWTGACIPCCAALSGQGIVKIRCKMGAFVALGGGVRCVS